MEQDARTKEILILEETNEIGITYTINSEVAKVIFVKTYVFSLYKQIATQRQVARNNICENARIRTIDSAGATAELILALDLIAFESVATKRAMARSEMLETR